jgi:hypothetical protein
VPQKNTKKKRKKKNPPGGITASRIIQQGREAGATGDNCFKTINPILKANRIILH